MTPPSIPTTLDGVVLDLAQREVFGQLLTVIKSPDHTRTDGDVVAQAAASFRKMHQVVGGAWVRRPFVQIGADGGPILHLGVEADAS